MTTVRVSLLLPTLAAAAAGLAGGWFLRGHFGSPARTVITVTTRSSPGGAAGIAGAASPPALPSGPENPAAPMPPEEIVRRFERAFTNEDPSAWLDLREHLNSLGMEELEASILHLKKLPDGQRQMVLRLVAARMGKLDPKGALAFGEAFAQDASWRGLFRPQNVFRNEVVRQWAADQPDVALTWASALPEGSERTTFLNTVAVSLARSDPASAVAVLEALPEDAGKNISYAFDSYSYQAYVHHVWSRTNPQAAAASALALRAGPVRDETFAAVARAWAAKDPAAALDWVGRLEWGKARDQARTSAVRAWAEDNPRAALEWSLNRDASGGNLDNLNLFSIWNHYAPDEARAWLERLPGDDTNRKTFAEWAAKMQAKENRPGP